MPSVPVLKLYPQITGSALSGNTHLPPFTFSAYPRFAGYSVLWHLMYPTAWA